ncbi:glutathione S-transferase protein [Cooperia oncophora]
MEQRSIKTKLCFRMVQYKVTYFTGRGLAEAIRQLLVVAGKDFEDVRLTFEDWPKHKDGKNLLDSIEENFHDSKIRVVGSQRCLLGQLPVLEVDGKKLCQSHAILRYLAREFGYAGKTAWDQAQVDAIADQYKDFFQEIRPYFGAVLGFQKGDPVSWT